MTDANGCSFIPNAFIVGADVAAAVNNVTCPGLCNGSISLTPSFGTPTYTYNWNNAATSSQINNLCPGNYCVTITDGGGSTRDTCFIITQPNPLNITATIVNDPDSNNVGAIDLNVTGGLLPITYLWSPGNANTQDLINLRPGLYCVTITYGTVCTADTCLTVAGDGISLNLVATQYGNFQTSCFGDCDGEITSVVSGGVAPYSYQWSNGGPVTADRDNLCAGTYSVTVTDASGTTAVQTRVIASPPQIVVTATKTLPSSTGASDGQISIVVSGGVPGYTYQWAPVSGNTSVLTNLSSGIYTVTVEDNSGCEVTSTISLLSGGVCYQGLSIITPNDDGKNDLFIILCSESIDNHLTIFNRYGGLVYETDNYANNWTGIDGDGDPLPDGGYHWVFEYTDGGGRQAARGTVVVLRTAD